MRLQIKTMAMILVVAIQGTVGLAGQAAPENWLLPPKTTITRDPAAIELIKASLKALNPQQLPPLANYTLNSTVVLWHGAEASGIHTESAVGLAAWSSSTHINKQLVAKSLRRSGIEVRQAADGTSQSFGDRRAMEILPHLPQPLLQEILDNPLDEIEMLNAAKEQEGVSQIRVTVRPRGWKPHMRDLKSASLDLFIANNTHLLIQVRGLLHNDGNPRHAAIHSYLFSQYKLMSGYLVPYSVEEQFGGRFVNRSTLDSIAFNQKMTPSDLQ